ncbi:MAG: hypothetical protein ACT4PW_04895 [Acidimicrobiia bacterium]
MESDGGITCEAHGTRHRRPATVTISVLTGIQMAKAGIPTVLRRTPVGNGGGTTDRAAVAG